MQDTPALEAPGTIWDRTSPVGRLLGAIDDAGDTLFDPFRGRPWADAAAAAVSNLSDYGVVWVVLAGAKARHPGRGRRRAVLALGAAGTVSYSLNRAVKALAARERPSARQRHPRGNDVLRVRPPTSTSFPSGHVLAAFCTAFVLPETRVGRRASLAFATAVAAGRVHLRAHHASDVAGAALLGAASGLALRRLVNAASRRSDME